MSSGSTLAHWLTLHGLVTVVAVLIYVGTSHVMHQRRHPAAAIAWMLFILLLPYLALPAFLTFGSRKLERSRVTANPAPTARHQSDDWAINTVMALGGPAPAAYRDLNVHHDGQEACDALFDMIESARRSIDLCTYILGRDSFGDALVSRLCRKASEGVRVRLLLDGLGSIWAARRGLRRLIKAGGAYTLFLPPLRASLKGHTNLRNHRKYVVTDAFLETGRLWCGGRNFATEYFNGRPDLPPWRDLSFDVRGPLVRQVSGLFEHDWAFANRAPMSPEEPIPSTDEYVAEGAQLVASGPDQLDDTVYALLVTAAYRARQHIAFVSPYFVPESALLMAMCLAARRGVAVDLLLPARSNHRLSDLARTRALRSLTQAGGRVWLAPGMLHAKLAIFDDVLALAGSVNLDGRSLFMNYELMMAFHKRSDVQHFAAWFEHERIAAHCYVPTQPGLVRDVTEGMLLWLGFQL
jgi:cardiolipin synthase A/B